jgi:hypothetical protein
MPRAATKADLIQTANERFETLCKMIESMSEDEQAADFCFDADAAERKDGAAHWKRDKNLRDVLIHLYEWHRLLIDWERANRNGENKPFLPPPYTWKTYGEMNVAFRDKHKKLNTPLDAAKKTLKDSHEQVIEIIEKYSDEELFTKAYFKWTGTSSLGQYCVSATASHYDWAIKKLKEQIKTLKK